MSNDFGILSYGAYLPRLRLQRKSVRRGECLVRACATRLAKGERAMANWDEDSITMAVEAARDCLAGRERSSIRQLILASTTHPYDDRQNAGIAANALNLPSALAVLDVTGSQRAGTSSLATALGSANGAEILVSAAEHRRAKAASPQEMHYGDGAAAFLVGKGKPIARLLASHSETVDFVDHFRGADADHDYAWEERWIRDEGYMKIVPRALEAALKAAGRKPNRSRTSACRARSRASDRQSPSAPESRKAQCAIRSPPFAATPAPRIRW
jgi:3-hydroxy-3-methylglutaryl CoA synthase